MLCVIRIRSLVVFVFYRAAMVFKYPIVSCPHVPGTSPRLLQSSDVCTTVDA
jgi:hypothetical protein